MDFGPSIVHKDHNDLVALRRDFVRILNEAHLTHAQLARIAKKRSAFEEGMAALIQELTFDTDPNNQQVSSEYKYPEEFAYHPVGKQIESLGKIFGLDTTYARALAEYSLPEIPDNQMTWCAIPKPTSLVKKFSREITHPKDINFEAIQIIVNAINKSGDKIFAHILWKEYRDTKKPSPECTRLSKRTQRAWDELSLAQNGDILILPVQFGMKFRGYAEKYANEFLAPNEFGLGIYGTLALTLLHPNRFEKFEELSALCHGEQTCYGQSIWLESEGGDDPKHRRILELRNSIEESHGNSGYGSVTGMIW